MTPRPLFATALSRVCGGTPACGILSRARGAGRDYPSDFGQQRLAQRRHRRVRIFLREGRHRIFLLIRRSRPIFLPSRKEGIDLRWDPKSRPGDEIRQRRRRSEGKALCTRGFPSPGASWGQSGCTRRHTGSVRVRLGVVGSKRHCSGHAVIDDRPTRRSTSPKTTKQLTMREPATCYGRGNGWNPLLLHQKL